MKLAEFCELCEREWGEARGDVIGLALTDESYAELTRDRSVLSPILLPPPLLNPVTRSPVKVTKGASVDSAEVTRHYGRAMDVSWVGDAGEVLRRGRLAAKISIP